MDEGPAFENQHIAWFAPAKYPGAVRSKMREIICIDILTSTSDRNLVTTGPHVESARRQGYDALHPAAVARIAMRGGFVLISALY